MANDGAESTNQFMMTGIIQEMTLPFDLTRPSNVMDAKFLCTILRWAHEPFISFKESMVRLPDISDFLYNQLYI